MRAVRRQNPIWGKRETVALIAAFIGPLRRTVVFEDTRASAEGMRVADDLRKVFEAGESTLRGITGLAAVRQPGVTRGGFFSDRVERLCAGGTYADRPR